MTTWEPNITAFLCNWCTYGAADLAGVSRLEHPPNIRIIRLPCSGRVSPKFILSAFRQGADGVWVSGFHPGDCHYIEGNFYARRKFALFWACSNLWASNPAGCNFPGYLQPKPRNSRMWQQMLLKQSGDWGLPGSL